MRGGKRAQRKGKPSISSTSGVTPAPARSSLPDSPTAYSMEDPGLIAQDLLKELHGDAFTVQDNETPKPPRARRQNSLRISSRSRNSNGLDSSQSSRLRGSLTATTPPPEEANVSLPPTTATNDESARTTPASALLDVDVGPSTTDIQLALKALAVSDDDDETPLFKPAPTTPASSHSLSSLAEKECSSKQAASPTRSSTVSRNSN